MNYRLTISSKISLLLGCNLSPLLFSLFINNLGKELNASGLGIKLGNNIISSIFFADDLVLIGSSRNALSELMRKTMKFCHNHRLEISEKKSKIMTHDATTGKTTFEGSPSQQHITLDKVISFKYLGAPLSSLPRNLFQSYNTQVKCRANHFLARVLSLVKAGPDRASLAYSLWTQVALPSILYGCEVLPLTQCTINEVEKCQAAVGKLILQIPRSSANVSVHIDAGLKPVWAVVAEKVLLYSHSIMSKPITFWPKVAMTDSITLGQKSPYYRYLMKWKSCTSTFDLTRPQIQESVKRSAISSIINQQRIFSTSTFAMNLPGSSKTNPWFKPKSWVTDSCVSQVFAQFRSCNVGLGNRGPTKDGKFYKLCPLCDRTGLKSLNNEVCIQ